MLILASNSVTRKSLLEKAGLDFTTAPATIDERAIEAEATRAGADSRDLALLLSQRKAEAVSAHYPGAIVIGADQILSLGLEVLHKPATLDDARAQLDRLAGGTHRLLAAVSLVRDNQLLWSHLETAELTMRTFSALERDQVLAQEGTSVLGSVGAYRLEGPSIQLFETVSGDYFTILGLPLLPLLAALRDMAPELLSPKG